MDGPQRLAEVFVELADTLVDDFDVVEFLQMLTERAVELLGADAAGLMLADQRGALQLMCSTNQRARSLEVFEVQTSEGPCLDCFTYGAPVVNVDLARAGGRWPAFTAAAAEQGYGAAHALPLRLRGQVIGAMNLFTDAAVHLGEEEIAVGQSMADIATIGLLQERSLREQTVLSEQLQGALSTRVLVEQAKGVLAERAGIDIAQAFTLMRTYARRRNTPLTSVATSVVDGSLEARELTTS
ncbi:GAF and ANTAR domain-containing protein [Pseudokineococcus marinus]|uniref:GAF and ANTAR domain-containing protein n=1 Tax=Pseudokineococcus marinus TaxID=351215 RepID=A0A849BWB8_9ACTN|nr:GAF and ANTAR domain-containing protein [Pseudokineococcus marinus]NNH21848.1 GAF and ANTAR domain-containing protein [Pseudokineococcus marinus]